MGPLPVRLGPGGRTEAFRGLDLRRGTVRSSRQQADPGRVFTMPPVPSEGNPAIARCPVCSGSRCTGPSGMDLPHAGRKPCGVPEDAGIRAWNGRPLSRPLSATVHLLPPKPEKYSDRSSDSGHDVPSSFGDPGFRAIVRKANSFLTASLILPVFLPPVSLRERRSVPNGF
jgi:hypothetical protein